VLTNVHPDEALKLVLEAVSVVAPHVGIEEIPLGEALGRALARNITSAIDHPPFDKAAMDGYAYIMGSNHAAYTVIDAVAAGSFSGAILKDNEAVRIMTGAFLPAGATGIQRFEWTKDAGTDEQGRPLIAFTMREKITNIIARGENLRKGEILLSPRILHAQDIGILAAGGITKVAVSNRPKVGIISTGDEIVEAGRPLPPASIYDSNGPQLASQAEAAGASARFYGVIRDREEDLRAALRQALADNHIIILSGGVSMGDFDLVPKVLESLGVQPVFHSLKMRPGKPTFFGHTDCTAVFCLPGNPVSTFVNFEVFVKPFIHGCMGLAYQPAIVRAKIAAPLVRKGSDRVEFLPGVLANGLDGVLATPLVYHGSSMITVLAHAHALFRMELGQDRIEAGEYVDARLIRT
jgi:molybdopterin molybdotransferase